MRKLGLIAGVFVVYLLHQDFWFWRAVKPLVLGVLPVGLFYHAAYTLAVAALMGVLVRIAWTQITGDAAGEDRG